MLKALVTCCATGIAGVALAGEANPPIASKSPIRPVTTFGYLDVDRDRRVSLQEARADWAVAQAFAAADADRDGYLDETEFKVLSQG